MITDKYPKTLRENLFYRSEIKLKSKDSHIHQDAQKIFCQRDRLYFFNVFVMTYDPRRPICKKIPFITYPFQDDVILWDADCARRQVDNLLEKSRDMGATWMCVGNDLYDWLFSRQQLEIRWGSRKEDLVDTRGDMGSIFEKFRFILRNLPAWMLPKGFNFQAHDNYMRLINPETGSSITGESTNSNFARGDRKYRVRFDEFSFWEQDSASWQSSADSTNCRTALSTPNGSSNRFAKLAKSDIEKKSLHWTLHPEKNLNAYIYKDGEHVPITNPHDPSAAFHTWQEIRLIPPPANFIGGLVRSPWYDAQCERRQSTKEVAEELDIDYARSGMPFFDLRMLAQQKAWKPITRNNHTDRIPHGFFIRANLVDIDNKMEPREEREGWLRIFEFPVKGAQYVLSSDISDGLAKGDESFAVVREKWSRNVVATCKGLYDPDDFAVKIQKIGAYYNKCLTAPEVNNHGFCFDKETEILTNNGWKKFQDLDQENKNPFLPELVATLNIEKNLIEFQKPLFHHKVYEEFMYEADRHHANFCVSLDHSMLTYARVNNNKKLSYLRFKPLSKILPTKYDSLILKHHANWRGREKKEFRLGKYKINMDDWLNLLGIFLADGNVNNFAKPGKRQYYKITIAQSKSYPDKIEKIREILKKLPFHFFETIQKQNVNGKMYNDLIIFTITNQDVWRFCIHETGIGKNKKAPEFIKDLSSRQIKIFLDSFFMGDGFARRGSEKQYHVGLAWKLADQIQEYIMKVGEISKITKDIRGGWSYIVHEHKHKRADSEKRKCINDNCSYLSGKDIKKVEYNDFAYCVSVPNKTVLVRRGGKAVFLGNSVVSDLKKMDCNLYWERKKKKDGTVERVKAGWSTTSTTRPLMLDQAREEIRKLSCEVRDPDIISQMETFVHNENNGKPEAAGDFKDDGVMAFAIGSAVILEHPYKPKDIKAPVIEHTGKRNGQFRFGRR